MRVRLPIIPGCNDSDENITETARFVSAELRPSIPVDLIPYHRLGLAKWEQLERPATLVGRVPDEDRMAEIRSMMESLFGLTVRVGG
jgi:pyruvate formate lyase activating enzyme